MARPKKKRGYSRIIVDDDVFQWKFDGVLVVVADSASSRRDRRLIVDWGWVDHLQPEYDASLQRGPQVITPAFVRLAIQRAQSLGWQPQDAGASFFVRYESGHFFLNDRRQWLLDSYQCGTLTRNDLVVQFMQMLIESPDDRSALGLCNDLPAWFRDELRGSIVDMQPDYYRQWFYIEDPRDDYQRHQDALTQQAFLRRMGTQILAAIQS